MKKYISIIAASLLAVSCVDTVILPDDKTVDEDFWKTKSDVQLMVNGAYKSMLSTDVMNRIILWSGLRSDELKPTEGMFTLSSGTYEALSQLNNVTIQYDNQFVTWAPFYSVINNCNVVLSRAKEVTLVDPSYTVTDCAADSAQMIALRSLCYFYLVRNYRDVPYVNEAHTTSSQQLAIPQSSPDSVINSCIQDLEKVLPNALNPVAYGINDWRRVGYFTYDGIRTLLADLYLWRGSVHHDAADYTKAVDYCTAVIESKKEQHRTIIGDPEWDGYPLIEGTNMFDEMFVSKNGEESIFELQFDGQNNSNEGVCQSYCRFNSSQVTPMLIASARFANQKGVYTVGSATQDYRGVHNTFAGSSSSTTTTEDVYVRKYVTQLSSNLRLTSPSPVRTTRDYAKYDQNFIIYRLTDVMLMKAEALVAQAADDTDETNLRAAFDLVNAVYSRSRSNGLSWDNYKGTDCKNKMETLVLDERLRELCFEGKRWYDLLRYNYRHLADGAVDYNTILADQEKLAPTYRPMLELACQKHESAANAIISKMGTEATLYLPVPKNDMELLGSDGVLKQNPVYGTNDIYEKNIK